MTIGEDTTPHRLSFTRLPKPLYKPFTEVIGCIRSNALYVVRFAIAVRRNVQYVQTEIGRFKEGMTRKERNP